MHRGKTLKVDRIGERGSSAFILPSPANYLATQYNGLELVDPWREGYNCDGRRLEDIFRIHRTSYKKNYERKGIEKIADFCKRKCDEETYIYGYEQQDLCCRLTGLPAKPKCYLAALAPGVGLKWTGIDSSIVMLGGKGDFEERQAKLSEVGYLTITPENKDKECPEYEIYDYIKTEKCVRQKCPYRFGNAYDGSCQLRWCPEGKKFRDSDGVCL